MHCCSQLLYVYQRTFTYDWYDMTQYYIICKLIFKCRIIQVKIWKVDFLHGCYYCVYSYSFCHMWAVWEILYRLQRGRESAAENTFSGRSVCRQTAVPEIQTAASTYQGYFVQILHEMFASEVKSLMLGVGRELHGDRYLLPFPTIPACAVPVSSCTHRYLSASPTVPTSICPHLQPYPEMFVSNP